MTVYAHPCPGTHHLEAAQLFERGMFPTDDIKVVLFVIDGALQEFRLIDDCPVWDAMVCARLIPQADAARIRTSR